LSPGEVFVVPQGVWHRLVAVEPSRALHITPGPHGESRPVSR
jgi:quercetin dioxygenase-like cupin family protein